MVDVHKLLLLMSLGALASRRRVIIISREATNAGETPALPGFRTSLFGFPSVFMFQLRIQLSHTFPVPSRGFRLSMLVIIHSQIVVRDIISRVHCQSATHERLGITPITELVSSQK